MIYSVVVRTRAGRDYRSEPVELPEAVRQEAIRKLPQPCLEYDIRRAIGAMLHEQFGVAVRGEELLTIGRVVDYDNVARPGIVAVSGREIETITVELE